MDGPTPPSSWTGRVAPPALTSSSAPSVRVALGTSRRRSAVPSGLDVATTTAPSAVPIDDGHPERSRPCQGKPLRRLARFELRDLARLDDPQDTACAPGEDRR